MNDSETDGHGGGTAQKTPPKPQRTHVDEDGGRVFIAAQDAGDSERRTVQMIRPQDAEILFWQLADWLGYDEMVPEWEVGVREADNEECWTWVHPRAPDPLTARRRALNELSDWDVPEVYECWICETPTDARFHEGKWDAWQTEDYQEFMEGLEA